MHDILTYVGKDPIYRRWEHQHLTFSMLYAWNENFILPFSHDEVVHGKGSMMAKVPGDAWQKAATLRALYTFMYVHPGKKLMFMGAEIGQWHEWNHDSSIDWHLLDGPAPFGAAALRRRSQPSVSRRAAAARGRFRAARLRMDRLQRSRVERHFPDPARDTSRSDWIVAVLNWTPVVRRGYRIGVPAAGYYRELLNSDAGLYGGSNTGNGGGLNADAIASHAHPYSLNLTLPPLGALVLKLDPSSAG